MKDIEKVIISFFEKIPHVIYVSLFGSFAKNTANVKSDVDIAVLFEKAHVPDTMTLIEWREQLSSLLEKDVDLISLNHCSPIIGMQVHKNGKTLLLKNPKEYGHYQGILFSDYAELKELREPMEKNILKRKFYD